MLKFCSIFALDWGKLAYLETFCLKGGRGFQSGFSRVQISEKEGKNHIINFGRTK